LGNGPYHPIYQAWLDVFFFHFFFFSSSYYFIFSLTILLLFLFNLSLIFDLKSLIYLGATGVGHLALGGTYVTLVPSQANPK
jgi:hypothetical protein